MAYFIRLLLACALGSFPLTTSAQPSFRCNGELNRSERAICASRDVSALDRRMAAIFRDKFRSLGGQAQRRLRGEQSAWLAWRNSCGSDTACLYKRYVQRISDLQPGSGAPSSSAALPADLVVDRRIRNNRFEVEYGDGRVEWKALTGSAQGTVHPDGTSTQAVPYQVEVDPLPPFSGATAAWGQRVEADLLTAIDRMLPEADRGPYRELFAAEPYSKRMLSHLRVIIHMVGQ